jgi:hypothetical protein
MMPREAKAVDDQVARRLRQAGFTGVSVVLYDPPSATQATCPDGYLLIEHLPDGEVPRSKAAVDAALARAGLNWRE